MPAVADGEACAGPQIWDLESKSIVDELKPTFDKEFGRKAQARPSLACLLRMHACKVKSLTQCMPKGGVQYGSAT